MRDDADGQYGQQGFGEALAARFDVLDDQRIGGRGAAITDEGRNTGMAALGIDHDVDAVVGSGTIRDDGKIGRPERTPDARRDDACGCESAGALALP